MGFGVGNELRLEISMEMTASREVKALSRLVEEKVLRLENSSQETLWNNLVPKKIIIFELRALKGRLPAREKIDLDSVLCPSCDNIVEFCVHGLVLCNFAMSVWEKIFNWWRLGNVNAFSVVKAAMNDGMNSIVYIVYHDVLGTFILLPFFLVHIFRFFILGILGLSLFQVLIYAGIYYSSPTMASAISNLGPANTFLLAVIFRMEKIELKSSSSQAKLLGTIIAITGATVFTFYQDPNLFQTDSSNQLLSSQPSNWVFGALILVICGILGSLWSVLQTKTARDYPDQQTIVFFFCLFGTIQSIAISPFLEGNPSAWVMPPGIGMIAVLFGAVYSTIIRNTTITWCLEKKGPVYVAMFSPLSIVIAVIMGVTFLGDSLHLGSATGATIVAAGFYTVMWGQAKEKNKLPLVIEEDLQVSDDLGSSNPNTPLLSSSTQYANRGDGKSRFNRLGKMEFPKFHEDDVKGWMFRIKQFFSIDATHSEAVTWAEYEEAMLKRFGDANEDPMTELKNLRYKTTIKQYQSDFKALLNQVNITEAQAISMYIAGLPTTIEMNVRMFKPRSLEDAFSLSSLQETTLALVKQMYNPIISTPRTTTSTFVNRNVSYPTKNTSTLALPAPISQTITKSNPVFGGRPRKMLSQKEYDEKRLKNQCFYCDQKYTPGHKCEEQMFTIEISEEEEELFEDCLEEENSLMTEYVLPEEV
nr:EamA domain, WAT1-related protein [Tanacetum cinerariifolium]